MKSRDRIENELLVLKCQMGDTKAFEELVNRWQKRLWRHAYQLTGDRDTAWDAVQDTWVAIVKGMRRLQAAGAFPRWAYRILSARCADCMRKRQRQRKLSDRLAVEANSAEDTCADVHDSLKGALARLPGERRALLGLRYAEGYSTGEIAEILGVPEGTVKSRLYHAREQLRRLMEGRSDE